MRIAVTGATGFLGRYIVQHLVDLGFELRCWHRATSDRSGFDRAGKSLQWIEGSLNDPRSIAPLLDGAEAVVHSGLDWERVGGFRSSGSADLLAFLESNFMGTMRLFQSAFAARIPRFVFISTCAVHEVILDDRPLDEAHPLWPTSHYGAHKAALEKFVHSFGLGEGYPICALRPTGIYGLAHPPQNSRWFDLVGQVMRGEPIESARGGKEVHAHDVARAVALLLSADVEAITGQSFNCYDSYVAEQHVANLTKELTGSQSSIADLNRGPKHQIVTNKIRALGMTFGGEPLLKKTVEQLVACYK